MIFSTNIGKRRFSLTITLLAVWFVCFSTMATAVTYTIDPDLMQKFRLVEKNGRKVVEVSMENLLALALERSTTVDILAINERIAREGLIAAREIYNPVLTTTVGIQHTVSPYSTNLSGARTDYSITPLALKAPTTVYAIQYTLPYLVLTASDTNSLSASWNKRSPNGILYSLSYQKVTSQSSIGTIQNEDDSLDEWSEVDDPLHLDSLTAAVKIPIFQDWGDINRHPEYKSMVAVEQTTMQSRKSKLELLNLVANIYWDLSGVHQNIQTLEASIRLAEQFLQDTKTRQKLGLLDPIEVKQSESQLFLVRQNLLQEVVRKNQIEDQIRAALNLEDLPYGYIPTEKMSIRQNHLDFEALLDEVYKSNQDLRLLNATLKMNRLSLKEARNKADPDMDLSLQYKLNGYGKDLSLVSSDMAETNLHDYQIGLTWNAPLFDKVTPQKIKQISLERARLDLQVSSQKSQLKVELQSILRNLELAIEGIKLAQRSVDLMEDLLRKEVEKFKVGNNTSFRVAQVQQDLTDVQKSKTLASIRYEKIYLSLLVLTERVFRYYRLPD
ncbi:MAG: TolC family protein [Proteobacteria bacterium]|nr:TolC family protein [Pseudomonadota bacterium]